MEQLGYINQPRQRLGRLSDQLWRAARIILDVSLHTGKMTVEEGINFLIDRVGLEKSNATAEIRRYTMFIEGWAFYCEELMEQLGYINQPRQRLGRLSDQLWRAARIILDVSLHTGKMTVEEGINFLIDRVGLEKSNATAEIRRYTMSPTQPMSYLIGKLEILKLIEEYKKGIQTSP